MRGFKETSFVVFDVETTGLSPRGGDRILEIGAIKLKGLKPVKQFHSLINPQRDIPFGAFLVHGISQEMVSGAPKAGEILGQFLDFIRGSCLVGHNVKFDMGFLVNEFSLMREDFRPQEPVIDTLKMARGLLPHLGSYSLICVAHALGIENEQEHRAIADVEMTCQVFCRLLELADKKFIGNLELLSNFFGMARPDETRYADKLATLNEAIASSRTLKMIYYSPHYASSTVRRITPRRILKESHRTIVVGFCHLRNEEREFRVDRIVQLEVV